MGVLKWISNNRERRSWAHRLRMRRFEFFLGLVERVERPWRLSDEGVRTVADAQRVADSIWLLTKRDLASAFPSATIYTERVFGLPKSFVAYGGWVS